LLIICTSKISLERVLRIASNFVWALFCIPIFLFVSTLIREKQEGFSLGVSGKNWADFPLEKIGSGPLSLKEFGEKSAVPNLTHEILLLAKNFKPLKGDKKKADFLLRLESSKEEFRANSGQIIFLNCDPTSPGSVPVYHFSEKKTPLWIRPLVFDKDKSFLEVGVFFPSEETESFQEEKMQFLLQKEDSLCAEKANFPFVENLSRSKLWGQDVLLSELKGSSLGDLAGRVKLEIPNGQGKVSFCFVKEGDFLHFGENGWVPDGFNKREEDVPLALVKKVSSKSIDVEVWDSEGFYSFPLRIEMENVPRLQVRPENLPASIRLRTLKQVSCTFPSRSGRKRTFLSEGDWVLSTPKGFRKLKKNTELESYIQHKINGTLLVFDSLVLENGRWLMKGFWVDEMRTQMQPFSLPVLGNGKAHSLRKEKKSGMSEKSERSFITYFPPISSSENTRESSK
jgi:hypothetical protein